MGIETGSLGLGDLFLCLDRCAKVGDIGDDWGVLRRTKVDIGMLVISVSEAVCLCLDSAPSFKATGLCIRAEGRGDAEEDLSGRSGFISSLDMEQELRLRVWEMGAE